MSQKQSTESHYLLSSSPLFFPYPPVFLEYAQVIFLNCGTCSGDLAAFGLSAGNFLSCLIENKLSVDSIFRSVELDSSADQMPVETKNGKSAGGDDDTVVSVSFPFFFLNFSLSFCFARPPATIPALIVLVECEIGDETMTGGKHINGNEIRIGSASERATVTRMSC